MPSVSTLIAAVATVVPMLASAATHDINWTWQRNKLEAAPGDNIVFRWRGGHNVWQMPASACGASQYTVTNFACPSSFDQRGGVISGGNVSPATYTVLESDPDYLCFWCEVGSHCRGGMSLAVKVVRPTPTPPAPEVNPVVPAPTPPSPEVNPVVPAPTPPAPAVNPVPASDANTLVVDWNYDGQSLSADAGTTLRFEWDDQNGLDPHNVYLMGSCAKRGDFVCPTEEAQWGDFLGEVTGVEHELSDDPHGCKDLRGKKACKRKKAQCKYIKYKAASQRSLPSCWPKTSSYEACFHCALTGHCAGGMYAKVTVALPAPPKKQKKRRKRNKNRGI